MALAVNVHCEPALPTSEKLVSPRKDNQLHKLRLVSRSWKTDADEVSYFDRKLSSHSLIRIKDKGSLFQTYVWEAVRSGLEYVQTALDRGSQKSRESSIIQALQLESSKDLLQGHIANLSRKFFVVLRIHDWCFR